MNNKRWIQASVAVVVVMWIVESVVHGLMLADQYKQTAALWRPVSEMENLMPLMWLGYALFAPFFVYLYAVGMEPKKDVFGQGLRFGLIFGVGLSAMHSLMWYAILPISSALAFYWFLGGVAVYAIAGVTVAHIYTAERAKPVRARTRKRR